MRLKRSTFRLPGLLPKRRLPRQPISFWRPSHAIRLADRDGNDATHVVTNWLPYLNTPNHPEYPSGTCANTAASIVILTNFFGNDFAFTAISRNGPSRQFARLTDAIGDAVEARVAAGAHYRFSCIEGVELGRRIAEHALTTAHRPLPLLQARRMADPSAFEVHVHRGSPLTYILEASPDFSQWKPWLTNTADIILHQDGTAAASDRRFYRATLNP